MINSLSFLKTELLDIFYKHEFFFMPKNLYFKNSRVEDFQLPEGLSVKVVPLVGCVALLDANIRRGMSGLIIFVTV